MAGEERYAIIVAGGYGKRMGSEMPKQFLLLDGLPIVMHTLRAFYLADPAIRIILVLPEAYHKTWDEICLKHAFKIEHQLADGGETRFHSVRNGLARARPDSLVAVHDGVRPLVTQDVIRQSYEYARIHGTAIPAVPVNESVRYKDEHSSRILDRKNIRIIQTPQTFLYSILKEAYQQDYEEGFTDDASVVESAGYKIHLIEGNIENVKITRKIDLLIAGALIR